MEQKNQINLNKIVEYRDNYIPNPKPSVSVTIDGHRYNIQ